MGSPAGTKGLSPERQYGSSETHSCPPSPAGYRRPGAHELIGPLTRLFFVVIATLVAYEISEAFAFPHITRWVSQIMAVGIGGVAAIVAGHFVLRASSRISAPAHRGEWSAEGGRCGFPPVFL